MKSFACGDVVPGCDARFMSTTDDEILAEVRAHAATAHGLRELSADVEQAVRSSITAR
jgi:predicted small metal-binding protein